MTRVPGVQELGILSEGEKNSAIGEALFRDRGSLER
jgi:hypothetical protein